jgi:hypothetical protein
MITELLCRKSSGGRSVDIVLLRTHNHGVVYYYATNRADRMRKLNACFGELCSVYISDILFIIYLMFPFYSLLKL